MHAYVCLCAHAYVCTNVCVVCSEVNLRCGYESGCSPYYRDRVSHLVRISVTSLNWLATCTAIALGLRGLATMLIFFLVVSGDWTHILTFVQRMLYRLSYLPPEIWIFLRITPSDLDTDPRKSFLKNTAQHWTLIFMLTPRHLFLVSWHPLSI